MSSYMLKARDKKTGVIHEVWALDDYFGNHRYGYRLTTINFVMTSDEFLSRYEEVRKPPSPEAQRAVFEKRFPYAKHDWNGTDYNDHEYRSAWYDFCWGWRAALDAKNNPASLSQQCDAQIASMSLHAAPQDAVDGGVKYTHDDVVRLVEAAKKIQSRNAPPNIYNAAETERALLEWNIETKRIIDSALIPFGTPSKGE